MAYVNFVTYKICYVLILLLLTLSLINSVTVSTNIEVINFTTEPKVLSFPNS
jgi:hypothetical protein